MLNSGTGDSTFLFIIVMFDNSQNQIFQYNGSPITFRKGDNVMVNATEMAKAFGKRPNDYLSLPSTNELIKAITRKYGNSENQIVITKAGSSQFGGGTWMYEDLALDFAQWLSVDFKLWCNDRIKELLKYGMTATQPTLEQMINNPDLVISLATQLKSERQEKERLEQDKKQLEEKTAKQEPYVSFAKAAFKSEGKVDIGQAAKILNLGFGRNTLFKKLREADVFFKDRNEPKQKYIDAGYFEMTLLPPIHRDSHPDILYQKVLCKPKGLAYINYLFGGKPSDGKTAKIK